MRIDRFLSNLKYGSRSEMTKAIKKGLVRVNDTIIYDSHYKLDLENEVVYFNDELVEYFRQVNIMIYKPRGYLSANRDNKHTVVFELLEEKYRRMDLKIAGRLDIDAEGLLILTSDGKFQYKITSPNYKVGKVYEVTISEPINNHEKLLEGVICRDDKLEEYLAKALEIEKLDDYNYRLKIDQGKFHQVKRMFIALGTKVVKLKRVQIGNLKLGDLKPGEYRTFEMEELYDRIDVID